MRRKKKSLKNWDYGKRDCYNRCLYKIIDLQRHSTPSNLLVEFHMVSRGAFFLSNTLSLISIDIAIGFPRDVIK